MTIDPLMLFWILLIGVIIGILIGTMLSYRLGIQRLRQRIKELTSRKQSLSTKYGMLTEQFAPFMKDYPFQPERFRFIGNPIDGIQFEDDQIIFIEFKTHDAQLTPIQKKIKQQIDNKQISWYEFRINNQKNDS